MPVRPQSSGPERGRMIPQRRFCRTKFVRRGRAVAGNDDSSPSGGP
ncbi:hypothetical protein [Azospirillum argentinense]|uniref:Uncharacterized protein n=1 Tax=Azospirillum argentinense TaxID=2970906 RepID=A0A5B0KXG2_9PROT|nr:hypothetical protein FH063_005073 [Azospirillum argentinense]